MVENKQFAKFKPIYIDLCGGKVTTVTRLLLLSCTLFSFPTLPYSQRIWRLHLFGAAFHPSCSVFLTAVSCLLMMIPFLYSYLLFYHKQILEYEWSED